MISFTVPLTEQDWDETRFGWRCPALKIPGARVDGVYDAGKVSDDWFEVDAQNELIKWQHGTPPNHAAACIQVPEDLKTTEQTDQDTRMLKYATVFVPVMVAAISAFGGFKVGAKGSEETPPTAATCETWTVKGRANIGEAKLKSDNLLAVMQPPDLNFDPNGNFVWYIPVALDARGKPTFPTIVMAVQGEERPAPPLIYLGFPDMTPQEIDANERRITLRDINFAAAPQTPYSPVGTN